MQTQSLPGSSASFHWSTWLAHLQAIRKKRGMARRLREIEIRNNQEEKRARDKHIVIVLVNVGECTWACFGDCGKNKTLANMATGKWDGSCLLATLTMKCDAAANPMILLRRAIGRTSAPYNQVVLFSIPSVPFS